MRAVLYPPLAARAFGPRLTETNLSAAAVEVPLWRRSERVFGQRATPELCRRRYSRTYLLWRADNENDPAVIAQ